ncbi:MAG: transporter substrate-binding domain-containing protein, partial [Cyclobacteriaceae bacterium]|nr:transporter substrate-binding domain-containing protein [Cyclobacteriaceae bacterium]
MFSINRFLLIFAVLALIQCRPPGVEYNAPSRSYNQPVTDLDFDKIKERGYLIALMDNSTTGMFMYRGKPMGYEYELLKMYTDSMGIGLRVQVVTNIDRAIEMLNNGEGDVLAYNLTVTRKRKERIAFTHWHNQARQVLVQRKPANWRTMKLHELEPRLIRNPIELIGKEVYVRYQSAHLDRLVNLSNEIGGEILIVQDFPNVETEELIQKVADGIIDYTIAEEDIARLNAVYHPELDVNTAISFPQQMAWGVRKNSKGLLVSINSWLTEMRSEPDFHTIYNKYYKSSLSSQRRKNSDFSSLGGGKLSP